MSKKSVWNKGKHNGGAVKKLNSPAAIKNACEAADKDSKHTVNEDTNQRINRVERMNRENWVSRPARVKPEKADH